MAWLVGWVWWGASIELSARFVPAGFPEGALRRARLVWGLAALYLPYRALVAFVLPRFVSDPLVMQTFRSLPAVWLVAFLMWHFLFAGGFFAVLLVPVLLVLRGRDGTAGVVTKAWAEPDEPWRSRLGAAGLWVCVGLALVVMAVWGVLLAWWLTSP